MDIYERFHNWMHFKDADRPPFWPDGFWNETIQRWEKEGLPQNVNPNDYFDMDRVEVIDVNLGFCPPYEEKIIEETSEYRIVRDEEGITKKVLKNRTCMPQYLKFLIKNRSDWEEVREEKLKDPFLPQRYPRDWQGKKEKWKNRDFILRLHAGSLFGWLRTWFGLERLCLTLYDDPKLIEDILDYLVYFKTTILKRVLEELAENKIKPNCAFFGEDIAYKTASMISPEHFEKIYSPRYKIVTKLLRDYGIHLIFVDSDGNISQLIPLYLETGINGFYPLEVAAGMDPVSLRKEYGNKILLHGGIDKRALAKGKREIDKELKKLLFLFPMKGYFPHCDHGVPPDVSWQNYLYYITKMKEISLNRALWQ